MTASFIADGHHLPPEAIKAMVRAKGPDRSILVSNTVAIARMPAGIYTTPVGGRVEMSADGRLSMEGRSTLAGGAIPLVHCIGRAMSMTGWALVDVLTMATVNPDALSETTADCRWADGRILFAFTGPMK
jgi:N-acetylglucosamine-6-phosphate deacetylase